MSNIHDRIEEVLAAAVHDELSDAERYALHVHLVECAECRTLHKENQLMNRAMEEVFTQEKPDFGFEKRLLHAFRQRAPHREAFAVFCGNLIRSRAVQFAGAAALVMAFIQLGRLLTFDPTAPGAAIPALPLANVSSTRSDLLKNDKDSLTKIAPAVAANAGPTFSDTEAAADSGNTSARGEAIDSTQNSRALLREEAPPRSDQALKAAASNAAASDAQRPSPSPAAAGADRKLIRNAQVDLEVENFDDAFQKITALVNDSQGYVATTSSEKQENGKLRGQVVVKLLPEKLDAFLEQLRSVGDVKNQTLGTEDVTKQYVDLQAHLSNAQAMEQRLLEVLKKKSDDINDLLAVEKELGRVREQIEQMQGEVKLLDSQVQFATVTIALAEKNMEIPAGFLLKERAQLSLFATDVEKVYDAIKSFTSPTVQITHATMDRDGSGHASARIRMLIAPEESDSIVARAKAQARVANFQVQSERVARGGHGMSEDAKTERDKVELDITISPEGQEPALQQTTLSVRTDHVSEGVQQLRSLAVKQGGRVQNSSFSRDPNGREYSNVAVRVPMKNYGALMQALEKIGRTENVSVHRQERPNSSPDEANAPVDVNMQVYSPGNIVANQAGIGATLRRTLADGAAALMWSVQMIGVAIAFLVPWALPIALGIWLTRRYLRKRAAKRDRAL